MEDKSGGWKRTIATHRHTNPPVRVNKGKMMHEVIG